jgi:hypothetical protein
MMACMTGGLAGMFVLLLLRETSWEAATRPSFWTSMT